MNSILPTVVIKTENGPVLINEADFNPKEHKLFKGEMPETTEPTTPTTEPTTPVTPETPVTPTTEPTTPVKMLVDKEGRKHFVVNENGEKIEAEGIDKEGYTSEADAWAAIMALTAK